MKKQFVFLVLSLCLLTSCHRQQKDFLGDYSYKISGEVTITDEDGVVTYRLVNKSGQMNILPDKTASSSDRVIVTMNEMAGGCYSIPARVSEDAIVFEPYEFCTNIISTENVPDALESSLSYLISSQGSGFLNGKILLVEETWSGHQSGKPQVILSANKMTILAEKN